MNLEKAENSPFISDFISKLLNLEKTKILLDKYFYNTNVFLKKIGVVVLKYDIFRTILDIPYFKEKLKGMNRMIKELDGKKPITNNI